MREIGVDDLKRLFAEERSRTAPPADFQLPKELPAGRYTDQRFWDLEQKFFWPKRWVCAGREEQVQRPGDYLQFQKLGRDIVIVRGENGDLRAFYNTCQHRGGPLVGESCGRIKRLTCAYHAWSYNLQGDLVSIPGEREFPGLDKRTKSLKQVRVECWGGWIFVNEDPDAEPLLDYLDPLPDEMAMMQGENLRLVYEYSFEVPCNWKVNSDAFLEVYHIKTIHPQTIAPMVDTDATVMEMYRNGHGLFAMPYKGGMSDPYRDRAANVESPPQAGESDDLREFASLTYVAFPNFHAPLTLDGYHILLMWPISIDRTELQVYQLASDWGEGPAPAYWDESRQGLEKVIAEDVALFGKLQRSLGEHGVSSTPLGYLERRIHHFHMQIDDFIGRERIPAELLSG
jgi:phenylpropionate dioxygenase-like ring-hydroxylating dioxygenase large terminal subunit